MDEIRTAAAKACLDGAYAATMDFPTIVGTLIGVGFEGYTVDYRRGTATYYGTDGGGIELPIPADDEHVAPDFSAERIQAAIYEAQTGAPGYTYKGFCRKVKAAGCAGYIVSFPGARVAYFGRSAEIHVEHFPNR